MAGEEGKGKSKGCGGRINVRIRFRGVILNWG